MRRIAATFIVLTLGSGVALAQTPTSPPPPTLEQQADEAARAMRDALERAMRLFDGVLGSIPQYEMPEVLPNGDIIIRRIPPAAPAPPQRPPQRPPERGPAPAPDKAPNAPKLEET